MTGLKKLGLFSKNNIKKFIHYGVLLNALSLCAAEDLLENSTVPMYNTTSHSDHTEAQAWAFSAVGVSGLLIAYAVYLCVQDHRKNQAENAQQNTQIDHSETEEKIGLAGINLDALGNYGSLSAQP